jgi:hypothetical protein
VDGEARQGSQGESECGVSRRWRDMAVGVGLSEASLGAGQSMQGSRGRFSSGFACRCETGQSG